MLLLPFFFSLCETNVLAFASVTPFSNYTGRDPAGRCVVFYHIRKSAGGTITSLLKRAGASSQRLDGNTGLQGWGGQGEEEISKDGKRKVASWEPSEHAELFSGHFKWGAHEMIGNALGGEVLHHHGHTEPAEPHNIEVLLGHEEDKEAVP